MTKTKDKTVKLLTEKETTTATAIAASAPSERYERREGIGFVHIKSLRGGTVETLLSNFTAEITADYSGNACIVVTRFRGAEAGKNITKLDPDYPNKCRSFDERLLEFVLSISPMTSIAPGKEKAVIHAIKTTSAPRSIEGSGADKKTNNTRKGNREA